VAAKNRVDLSSISEVSSYITEWPRFFGATLYSIYAVIKLALKVHDVCFKFASNLL